MRIDIPYSVLLRDGDLLWSCGQCPLDRAGAVRFPGELLAQSEYVADIISGLLSGGNTGTVVKLVAYFVRRGPMDESRLVELLRRRFGPAILVFPVEVPHFYYDGMMVEIDVHAVAGGSIPRHDVAQEGTVRLETVRASSLVWVKASLAASPADAGQVGALERMLEARGSSASVLLNDQWTVGGGCSETILRDAGRAGLARDPGAAVATASDNGAGAVADLTFGLSPRLVRRHVELQSSGQPDAVHLQATILDGLFSVSARCDSGRLGNVEEMRASMRAVDGWMRHEGLSFSDVCKSTTHYVADGSAEALHDNMAVRNAYYCKPGPASTGVPIKAFASSGSHVAVNIIGRTMGHVPEAGRVRGTPTP